MLVTVNLVAYFITYIIVFALILIMGELKGQLFIINQKPHEFKCQLGRLKS